MPGTVARSASHAEQGIGAGRGRDRLRAPTPRPTLTRKKRLQRAAPSSRASELDRRGSPRASPSATSVFTWKGQAELPRLLAGDQRAREGALHPADAVVDGPPSRRRSRARSRRRPPPSSARIASRVSRGVALGETETSSPSSRPFAISAKRSGRSSGSPPVRTTWGFGLPLPRAAPRSRKPSSVSSSSFARVGRSFCATVAAGEPDTRCVISQ
jgi:hypothetical protein